MTDHAPRTPITPLREVIGGVCIVFGIGFCLVTFLIVGGA